MTVLIHIYPFRTVKDGGVGREDPDAELKAKVDLLTKDKRQEQKARLSRISKSLTVETKQDKTRL